MATKLPEPPLEDLSFAGLCIILDKLRGLSKEKKTAKQKSEKLKKLVFNANVTCARARNENIYCYVRLLLPASDKHDRGNYGVKAQKLSTIFLAALDLRKESDAGKIIKNWKEGASGRSSAIESDLAGKVRDVVTDRAIMFGVGIKASKEAGEEALGRGVDPAEAQKIATQAARDSHGTWALRDVNDWLDRVAQAYAGGMAAAEHSDLAEEAAGEGAGAGAGISTGPGGGRYEKSIDDSNYVPLFKEMLNNCGPSEVGWLTSIMLLDLRIGLKSSCLLKWFHPDASEHFSVNSSLRALFSNPKLSDAGIRCKGSISLFTAFDCIRADRLNYAKPQMLGKDFIIEQKLDGERLLLHYRRASPGAVLKPDLKAWSRNKLPKLGYAKTLRDHFLAALSPNVMEVVLDGELVAWDKLSETPLPLHLNRRFSKAERYAKRDNGNGGGGGGNGGGGGGGGGGDEDDDDNASEDGDYLLRASTGDSYVDQSIHYFAFDCLWLVCSTSTPCGEGRVLPSGDLTQLPLRERRLALAAALPRDVLGHFKRLTPLYTCIGLQSDVARKRIDEALLASHERLEEGIVIKELERSYEFHRSTAQLKLKPEYVTGANENLDVVVVGGYHVEGASWRTTAVTTAKTKLDKKLIWVFLCALPRWASPSARLRGDDPVTYAPLCVAGSGVKPSDAAFLLETLGHHWFAAPKTGPMPKWLCSWVPSSTLRPDFLIKPEHSIVLELKGSELMKSDTTIAAITTKDGSKIPVTVKFPRINNLRMDKLPRDADTEEKMSIIWNERGGKMIKQALFDTGGKRKRGGGGAGGPATTRRRGPQLLPAFVVDSKAVPVISDILYGWKFVLLPHDECDYSAWANGYFEREEDRKKWGSKEALTSVVKKYGGTVVMQVLRGEAAKAIYIGVGQLGCELGMRVKNIAPPYADIFSPAWLVDALAEGQLPAQVRPEHFVRPSSDAHQRLMRIVDPWGDEHASPALEIEAVRSLLTRVVEARACASDADVADASALVALHPTEGAIHTLFRTARFREGDGPRARLATAYFPAVEFLDSDLARGASDAVALQAGLKAWTTLSAWRDYGGRVAASPGVDVDVIFIDVKRTGDVAAALALQPRAPVVDMKWIHASVRSHTLQPLAAYTHTTHT